MPANRWTYSKRSLRPKPPMVWLSFSTNVSAGCCSIAWRSFFSSRSIPFLPRGGVERGRVEEDVDVFREPLDQVPALRQAGAALEDDLAAGRLLDDAQRLRDVVILLDDRLAQAARAEMLRRADDGLLEVRMLKQPHGSWRSFACHCRA